jgi:hypothetical protein
MERREFFKNVGIAGLCSCFVSRLLATETASAPQQPPQEDWRIDFARQRYSRLVSLLAARVDEGTFQQIMEEVGKFCSDSGFAKQFPGRLEAYLAEMERRWGAKASFDPATQTAHVSFQPQSGDCACPLMGKGLVPGAACRCSVGAMRRSFSVVVGHPVTVDLKESVLQGGKCCAFAIHTQPA